MTSGSTTKHMLCFALPLMLGNVFQQLYGTVSAIVVGRYLGKDALAAMGTAIPVMNIMIFLLVGMTMGVSILMAESFGAKEGGRLKKELATAIAAGTVFTLALSFFGIVFIRPALEIINAPDAIIPQAVAFLRIVFAGMIFVFLYNLLSSALRAVGESTMPLVFLIFSSVLNIIFAFLFVGTYGMGIEGAALATVIAEIASVAACAFYIYKKVPALRLELREIRIETPLLAKTVSYSWVSGLQQTFLFVGIFLVQGAVNPLGVDAIAAFNAASRIDGFIMAPSDSLALSLMMFISQNKGAGKNERIRDGLRESVVINAVTTALLAAAIYLFAHRLVGLFLDAGERGAVEIGARYLKALCLFYMLTPVCNTMQGFFRGIGKIRVALYATFIQIPIRVFLSCALTAYLSLNAVAVAIGTGWGCMILYQWYEYRKCKTLWTPKTERVVKNEIRLCR